MSEANGCEGGEGCQHGDCQEEAEPEQRMTHQELVDAMEANPLVKAYHEVVTTALLEADRRIKERHAERGWPQGFVITPKERTWQKP